MSPVMTTGCHYHGGGYVQGVGMSRGGRGYVQDGYVQGVSIPEGVYPERVSIPKGRGEHVRRGRGKGTHPPGIGPAGVGT